MNAFVIMLLVGLWASILVPGALRSRQHSPVSSVDSFERSMSILASDLRGRVNTHGKRMPGRHVLVVADPRAFGSRTSSRQRTLQRRRMVLQGLVGAVAVSAVLAVALGGMFAQAFWVVALALAGYVGLLVWLRTAAEQARRTVRRLPVAVPPTEREFAPQPIASGQHR